MVSKQHIDSLGDYVQMQHVVKLSHNQCSDDVEVLCFLNT